MAPISLTLGAASVRSSGINARGREIAIGQGARHVFDRRWINRDGDGANEAISQGCCECLVGVSWHTTHRDQRWQLRIRRFTAVEFDDQRFTARGGGDACHCLVGGAGKEIRGVAQRVFIRRGAFAVTHQPHLRAVGNEATRYGNRDGGLTGKGLAGDDL